MVALLTALVLAAYDPLVVGDVAPTSVDLTAGAVPVRVYLPASTAAAPVILFSHGLGGSKENNRFLGEHWAKRGYVAVFLQHAGSDNTVWETIPKAQRYAAMKSAASVENFLARVDHVHAVLDAFAAWNKEAKHPLEGRLDLAHVGMSGHSFGAVTTQAVSGQHFPFGKDFTDTRIKAAFAMSPSVPKRGDAKSAFADVKIPWLLMTGTADTSPIGGQSAESRLGVFPALPAGQKYELVLDGAEHSAFSERALPGDDRPRNPNHHRAMLALSTAFFDATLRGDAKARIWLEGNDARAVLEPKDRWQWK